MSATTLFLITIGLGLASFVYGRSKAFTVAGKIGGVRAMHSLPSHYGMMVALWCALPALAIIIGWKLLEPTIVSGMLDEAVPQAIHERGAKSVELYKNEIYNLADGGKLDTVDDEVKRNAAERLNSLRGISSMALMVLVLATAIAGASLALRKIKPDPAQAV